MFLKVQFSAVMTTKPIKNLFIKLTVKHTHLKEETKVKQPQLKNRIMTLDKLNLYTLY